VTDVVEVSVGEIARVGVWALRGLGMAFGVADRAAPIVGWAEAVEGHALKALRTATSLIDGHPRGAAWYGQVSEAAWTLDATGRSLLEVGPVAADLLTLAARTGHVGRVDVENVIDPVFLSGVVRIAARRQVGIVALSPGPHLTLCGIPVATLHAFPGRHGPMFEEGGIPQNSAIDRAVASCLEQLTVGQRAGTTISILSYAPSEISALPVSAPSRFEADRKFALAQSQGVPVEREDLAHLYQLLIRTWAPTSERSRKQALA
jgi:hypothetical protein